MPNRLFEHDYMISMATKTAYGTGTTVMGVGAVGIMGWLSENVQAIAAIVMIIGCTINIGVFLINLYYQRKRDQRESQRSDGRD